MRWHVPVLGDQLPRRGNAISSALARVAMRLAGWTFEGVVPNRPKLVFIVAPHTSNWDFVVGVVAMFALGLHVTFLGKDTLFRGPFGAAMRWLGGIPVYRHAPRNVVEQTVDLMRARDRVALGLSPEGTRRKLPQWRTGFHYVARGAGVPIVPVALDYSTRTIRLFALHEPAAGVEDDLATLGRLFHAGMARRPAQY